MKRKYHGMADILRSCRPTGEENPPSRLMFISMNAVNTRQDNNDDITTNSQLMRLVSM